MGDLMQVEAGESKDCAQGYKHSKTEHLTSGVKVTGRFARQLAPSYLRRRVECEGGNCAQ